MYEVAITGIGIVSCLGTGCHKVGESLKQGKSGIIFSQERKELGFRSCLTGHISDFVPPALSLKKTKTMTEFTLQAYAASLEAVGMAGWSDEEIQAPETGLLFGNDSSTLANAESVQIVNAHKSTLPIGAQRVFQSLNSNITMNLNTLYKNRGISLTISSACSSGGHAIGFARDLIAAGRQERIICGGAQEINWQSVCSFDATNAFSLRMAEPERACRPFDKDRDGLVPSGGAAVLALERMDLAKKRGAKILGKVAAYAFSADGGNLTTPTGLGLKQCMEESIRRARIELSEIDYVSAHATSTPIGDAAEARCLSEVFGSHASPGRNTPWISSLKSMTGHEMWMSGAAQVVYVTLMHMGGFIAPNLNFHAQEEGAPPLKIAKETIDKKPMVVVTNSAGFGGTNSCLVIDYRL
jgi:3-oxoacyl-[acyl-carrier-protein] synthase-1